MIKKPPMRPVLHRLITLTEEDTDKLILVFHRFGRGRFTFGQVSDIANNAGWANRMISRNVFERVCKEDRHIVWKLNPDICSRLEKTMGAQT